MSQMHRLIMMKVVLLVSFLVVTTLGQSSDNRKTCSCVPANRKAKICASVFSIAGRVLTSHTGRDKTTYLVKVLKNYDFQEERLKTLTWITTPRFGYQCGFSMKKDTVYFLNGYFQKNGLPEVNKCGYNMHFFDVPHSLRREMRYPDYCDNHSWKKYIRSEKTAKSTSPTKDVKTDSILTRNRIIFA